MEGLRDNPRLLASHTFLQPTPLTHSLTVWAALLDFSGGKAIGDGGPVPAPVREIRPAPIPGEDWNWRLLSPPPLLPAEGGKRNQLKTTGDRAGSSRVRIEDKGQRE